MIAVLRLTGLLCRVISQRSGLAQNVMQLQQEAWADRMFEQ